MTDQQAAVANSWAEMRRLDEAQSTCIRELNKALTGGHFSKLWAELDFDGKF